MKNMSHKKTILLVEDEESLAVGLEFNLSAEGYNVIWALDGKQALEKFDGKKIDLIVLDIMLPFMDGFEVAEKIRQQDTQIPILILTARSGIQDRIRGLETGADDYMSKPFHLDEFLLRIKGMLRRKEWYREAASAAPAAIFGNNEINFENMTARAGDQTINLTVHEAMLLKYLIENKGKIVSRKELLENVWNMSSEIETRTVDNFIARLRKYFEPDQDKPTHFRSVRGVGYQFNE